MQDLETINRFATIANERYLSQITTAVLALLALLTISCTPNTKINSPTNSVTQTNAATSSSSSSSSELNDDPYNNHDEEDEDDRKDEDDAEDRSLLIERAENSNCHFFKSGSSVAFGKKPADWKKSKTNIDHFPPAEYPLPLHETFPAGYYDEDDDFVFVAAVDVLINTGRVVELEYEERWKVALPGEEEDDLYDRMYFEITIANADSRGCSASYSQLDAGAD